MQGAAMGFQSVRDLNVKGHRVFLRADLNVCH
jgi:3-phosphoglycerate kinase